MVNTITTENIYSGLFVKNYPSLCNLLNDKVKKGKSKILQLEEWKRIFNFDRELNNGCIGRGYKIIEVYLTEKSKERKLAIKTIIRNLVILEDLLNELDETKEKNESYRTTKELYLLLGICNDDFFKNRHISQLKLKNNPMNLALYNKSIFFRIPLNDVRSFYEDIDSKGRSVIYELLTTLQKQCNVEIDKSYNICIDLVNDTYRYCTEDEYSFIKSAIGRTLPKYSKEDEHGVMIIPTEKDIFLSRKFDVFYKDVANDSILQESGIKKFYTIYKFTFTSSILKFIELYNKDIHVSDKSMFLNQRMIKSIELSTCKRIIKHSKLLCQLLIKNPTIDMDELCTKYRITGLRGKDNEYWHDRKLLINKLINQYEEIKVKSEVKIRTGRWVPPVVKINLDAWKT